MPFPIEDKLVVAISSSAVFDMHEADHVFRSKGERAYRQYQLERLDVPFDPGTALPFLRRLLRLNELFGDEKPVEVVVLSRNDPDSGRRFFRSCKHHDLNITRGAFTTGRTPYPYMKTFNALLYLSANELDVRSALSASLPAGLCLPSAYEDDPEDSELRIAFDFDGVVIDDEAERVYQRGQNLDLFHRHEVANESVPHKGGPLEPLIRNISRFQRFERKRLRDEPSYQPSVRIGIVTARNAPSHERMITTLRDWGVEVDELLLLGGIKKSRALDVLRPHIFFDDQINHLTDCHGRVPSVHIPFGVSNAVCPRVTDSSAYFARSGEVLDYPSAQANADNQTGDEAGAFRHVTSSD